ncbi:MAG: DNA-binding protein [Bacteroidetes bacterium HGW-Bacteroidetes-18]|nr:MAG: DNA-binding protein [Bacteroidetes bacterium HGW-Bacteroidetes-18]
MDSKSLLLEAVTLDQLKELIESGVRRTYYKITCDLQDKYEKEDLMTRDDAAKFLKINLSTLYYWTKKGMLNSYGIANRRYYKRSEILDCLNKHYVQKRVK